MLVGQGDLNPRPPEPHFRVCLGTYADISFPEHLTSVRTCPHACENARIRRHRGHHVPLLATPGAELDVSSDSDVTRGLRASNAVRTRDGKTIAVIDAKEERDPDAGREGEEPHLLVATGDPLRVRAQHGSQAIFALNSDKLTYW